MNLADYLAGPGAGVDGNPLSYLHGLVEGHGYGLHLGGGLWQFTPETACHWAGPWAGGFATWRLTDHRESRHYVGYHRQKARKQKGPVPEPPLLTTIGDGYVKRYGSSECVTTARPFELRLHGNDDTSYTKFFASAAEATEAVALFENNQPLDFFDLIRGFGFVFTN